MIKNLTIGHLQVPPLHRPVKTVIEYTTKQDVLHHKKEDSFERRERKEGNNFYMKITHWLENITISNFLENSY